MLCLYVSHHGRCTVVCMDVTCAVFVCKSLWEVYCCVCVGVLFVCNFVSHCGRCTVVCMYVMHTVYVRRWEVYSCVWHCDWYAVHQRHQ